MNDVDRNCPIKGTVEIERGNNMFKINDNYLKLPGSYLFSTIAKKVAAYSEANPDKAVKLNYSQSDLTTMLSNVESGKYDFQLIDRTTLNAYLSDYGLKLKAVELPQDEADNISSNPYAYYLLPKTEEGEALAKEINQAFEEVVADGTALKISEQYLNGDYLPKEVEEKAGTGSAESVSGSSAVSSS